MRSKFLSSEKQSEFNRSYISVMYIIYYLFYILKVIFHLNLCVLLFSYYAACFIRSFWVEVIQRSPCVHSQDKCQSPVIVWKVGSANTHTRILIASSARACDNFCTVSCSSRLKPEFFYFRNDSTYGLDSRLANK